MNEWMSLLSNLVVRLSPAIDRTQPTRRHNILSSSPMIFMLHVGCSASASSTCHTMSKIRYSQFCRIFRVTFFPFITTSVVLPACRAVQSECFLLSISNVWMWRTRSWMEYVGWLLGSSWWRCCVMAEAGSWSDSMRSCQSSTDEVVVALNSADIVFMKNNMCFQEIVHLLLGSK